MTPLIDQKAEEEMQGVIDHLKARLPFIEPEVAIDVIDAILDATRMLAKWGSK